MKNKKIIFISIGIVIFIAIATFITMRILRDENRLTVAEKEWINTSTNKQRFPELKVINDTNIFGSSGSGVFFDFIKDFETEYNIDINPVTYATGGDSSGLALKISNTFKEEDIVFYTDHFVLAGIQNEFITSLTNLKGSVGILKSDSEQIRKYINTGNITFVEYETEKALFSKFAEASELAFVLVPRMMYIDNLLTTNHEILFHLPEINQHYILETNESLFSNVLVKYARTWIKENVNTSVSKAELTLFSESLEIPKKDLDALVARSYTYGFINTSPYELLSGGNHGGISSTYLKRFSDFSGIEIKFSRYKNQKALTKALNDNEIDIVFGYSNNALTGIDSGLAAKYVVVSKKGEKVAINSVKGLVDKNVYVLESTPIENYLKTIDGVRVSTYKTENELKKILKKNGIIVMDDNVFNFYKDSLLSDYTVRFEASIGSNYTFRTINSDNLVKLMKVYFKYLDPNEMVSIGLKEHDEVLKSGTIAGTVARYSLYLFGILFLAGIIVYQSTKRVKIVKRIKKEDKMRFIDQLTSLKNRNYLSENIDGWNKNTIYPQTAIVIDLNGVQGINDTLGYEEGDKQIKAAANVLIKTQLDNTDIIRTDGNEFLVYMVGHQDKQIASYLRKLNKEFKSLPHEFGAAIGYSAITDNLKTVEDAINEAVEHMRSQKDYED